MLQVQLATPLLQLPKLETEKSALHNMMYGDSNQLMLRAQVYKSLTFTASVCVLSKSTTKDQ